MTASGVPASNFYGENAPSKRANQGQGILLSFDRQAQLQERLLKLSINSEKFDFDADISEQMIGL